MFVGRRIPFSVILSLLIHGLIFAFALLPDFFPEKQFVVGNSPHKFKLKQLRAESPLQSNMVTPQDISAPTPSVVTQPKRPLSLSDLAAQFDKVSTAQSAPQRKKATTDDPGIRQQSFKAIKYQGKTMSQSMKMSQLDMVPPSARSQLQNTFSNIQIDRENKNADDLNKDELVFYSFFNRVGEAYMHAFAGEINEYQKRYPSKKYSLPFPEEPTQVMAEITYDENGDILRIKTLRWSDVGYFQDFFMNVMQALDNLPNPPKELIKADGTFSIKYSLQIKI